MAGELRSRARPGATLGIRDLHASCGASPGVTNVTAIEVGAAVPGTSQAPHPLIRPAGINRRSARSWGILPSVLRVPALLLVGRAVLDRDR